MSDIEAPKNTKFKGRNGFADLHHVEVFAGSEYLWLDFFSKKIGRSAPMMLRGSAQELAQFLRQIADVIDEPARRCECSEGKSGKCRKAEGGRGCREK